jgi:DNA-binding XRE family transcriptional regulator
MAAATKSRRIPKAFYVYTFAYPAGMPNAGAVFYVGKGTSLHRMDHHFKEAVGGCQCQKCQAIRSVWDTGLPVERRIIFDTVDEQGALQHEQESIARYQSEHLTNKRGVEREDQSSNDLLTDKKDWPELAIRYPDQWKKAVETIFPSRRNQSSRSEKTKTPLRRYREELCGPKVTQEHMALQVGVSLQWYRHLENNPAQPTSYTTALAILRSINAEHQARGVSTLTLDDLYLNII